MSEGNPYPFFFDFTDAQDAINDSPNPFDAPAPAVVHPYPHSQAGPSSGTGSAVGPIRSAGVPSMGGPFAPYTRQRPRSTESRDGQGQPQASNVALYRASFAEEWNAVIAFQSELAGSGGQMGATVASSAGSSSNLAPPALIAKREAAEPWTGAHSLAPGNATGSGRWTPFHQSYAGAQAVASQPSSSLMMAPSVPSHAGVHPSPFLGAAQTTAASPSVQQAYSRLAAGSRQYRRCQMHKCQMQHWNGIVLHQVRQEVAQYKGPAVLKTENLKWDLLQRYPEIAAYIHGTLRWKPAREIHLHSLSSASAIDANGRDLTTAIPGFDKIPGSLQLLVMSASRSVPRSSSAVW